MNKEQVYDEQISPLMSQIIAICKERKIALVAQFAIPTDGDPELVCSTVLLRDEYGPTEAMKKAARILTHRKPAFVAMTVTTPPRTNEKGDA